MRYASIGGDECFDSVLLAAKAERCSGQRKYI